MKRSNDTDNTEPKALEGFLVIKKGSVQVSYHAIIVREKRVCTVNAKSRQRQSGVEEKKRKMLKPETHKSQVLPSNPRR